MVMDASHCCLDGNADAVEFCPHDPFHHVLAASTYNLQEEGDKPSRLGRLSLFDVDAEKGRLELIHRMETCGIFDIKWNPVGSSSCQLLGQADADGYLKIYKLSSHSHSEGGSEPTDATTLREVSDVKVSTSMFLYIDWNPSATVVAIGISDGSVAVVSVTESGVSLHQQWEGHQFEVWTSSFDCHLPHLVYTGSDDCRFCGWDLRDDPSNAAFQNTKAHSAGVCCITKNPNDPNTLLTGSYDEYLRVWDMRSLLKPVNEKSLCLGGGVWRIKYHPSIPDMVLSACMHNGFAIVDTKASMLEIVETCSFYDKLLRIWRPQFENGA